MVAKSLTNRRYHPAVPRKLRNSFTDFGSGIFWIAAILSPSIRSVPPPIMNPRHSATNRRYFRWVSKSGAMISRSSRYTKTFDLNRAGITLSISRHSRCAALHRPNGIMANWYKGLPATVNAVYGRLSGSNSTCQNANFKSTHEI
ncbi:uncharacterized protein LOC120322171 isoform X1 [Drosophila yakuba]|uniref:uncharacterized protein LOC120322171 isoform X1 n=1 Tax=Drosophila yakuba TaxID=7245 RepID=UPI001930759D|nr:uncharacterized protein LOC120322171 isoform X1 [Drosophila yakuba]